MYPISQWKEDQSRYGLIGLWETRWSDFAEFCDRSHGTGGANTHSSLRGRGNVDADSNMECQWGVKVSGEGTALFHIHLVGSVDRFGKRMKRR
jgi:hypothetical protein